MPEAPGEQRSATEPSLLNELFHRTRRFLSGWVWKELGRPLEDWLGGLLGRAAAYLGAAGLLVTSAVFLLIAGVHGLREAGASPALSYALAGLTALGIGLGILRAARGTPRRKGP